MPSKSFTLSKTRLESRRLARTLRGNFSAQPDVKSAAVLGNKLIAVGGSLYDSTVDGSEIGNAIAVTNIGRPAAAIYAPSSGGVAVIAQAGASAGAGGATSFSGLTGTIADSQAPQFLKTDGSRNLAGNLVVEPLITVDGVDLDVHATNPDAHHPRLHDIFSASDHSYAGASALDVFGFNGSALGWLTPSANPGAASMLLKSSAAGNLALPSLTTPLLNSSGNLTIDPAGDVLFPNSQIVRTETFSSSFPIGGFELYPTAISGQSGLTIGVIEADELRVRVFVANETRVDRGEKYDSKSFGITSEPFTTPSSIGGTVRIYFEDSPAISGAIFSNNDWLLFRAVDINTGLSVVNVWGQVSSYLDETGNYQSWLFTLRQGATNYLVGKSSFSTDWGASGQGLIHYSAVDPTGAPYIEFLTWAGANPYTPANWTTHVRIGKLVTSLDNNLLPTGYGLYGDNVFLAGDFLTAGGYIRMYQATGINIQEDVWGSWDNKRALQWWADVTNPTGNPSLAIYTGKVVGGFTSNQNFAYIDARPSGGQAAGLQITAFHQGSANDAYLFLQGGSSALPAGSSLTLGADAISLIGPLAANVVTVDGLLPSNANTPNNIGANANRFDTIYADNIVAGTLTATLSIGSTLSGAIWQNDASNMTIESDSTSDRVLFITNAGTGKMSINVDNDIIVGGNVDGVDVSTFYTAYGTHSHSHGTLSNLTADDHTNYVHISTNRTITAQHSFSPGTARAPFVLGANAQSQLVTGLRADQVNRQVIAGGGLTGTGLLTSDVTLAISWGTPTISTITPDATASAGIAVTPARSDHVHAIVAAAPSNNLTVATTNAEGSSTSFARADHSHAITSSNNPGTAASLLASTSVGGLTLQTLTLAGTGTVLSSAGGVLSMADDTDTVHKVGRAAIGHASYSDFAAFSHRDMSAAGQYGVLHDQNGLLFLNATTGNMIYHRINNADVMQMNVSRLNPAGSNLIALGDYNRKWSELNVNQLVVDNLVASNVMATIGGRIMVAPTAKLTRDITNSATTIYLDTNSFAPTQVLYMAGFKALTIQNERMRVVSGPTTVSATEWSYVVARNIKDTGSVLANGTFEVDTAGWINAGSSTLTIARDTTDAAAGVASLKATLPGVAGIPVLQTTLAVAPSTVYSISFYAKTALSAVLYFDYLFYDSGAVLLTDGADTSIAASTGWTRYSFDVTTTSTTASLVLRFFMSPSAAYTGNFRLDEVIIEQKYGLNGWGWYIGDANVNVGYKAGTGYIDLTSLTTIMGHYGPTIATYARPSDGAPVKPVTANGNLRSFVDYVADTFGFGLGNDLTLSPTGGFVGMTADAASGLRLFNVTQKMYSGGTEFLRIDTGGIGIKGGVGAAGVTSSFAWYDTNIGNSLIASNAIGYLSGAVVSGSRTMTLFAHDNALGQSVINLSANSTASLPTTISMKGQHTSLGQNGVIEMASHDVIMYEYNNAYSIQIRPNGINIGKNGNNTPSSGLYLTQGYGALASTGSSEISNDTSAYFQLMILGNTSAGGSRRVGIWDSLQIGGAPFNQMLNVNGSVYAYGSFMAPGKINDEKFALDSSDGSFNLTAGQSLPFSASGAFSGLVLLIEPATGAFAMYSVSGGSVNLINSTGGVWTANTTSGSNQFDVSYVSSKYQLKNKYASTKTFNIMLLRVRAAA